jgi:hypothetical protein
MKFILHVKNVAISVFVNLYKGLVLYFLFLVVTLFYLDDGSWVNLLIVSLGLMLLPLFIALALRRRFSR